MCGEVLGLCREGSVVVLLNGFNMFDELFFEYLCLCL